LRTKKTYDIITKKQKGEKPMQNEEEEKKRVDKTNYYLQIAEAVAKRGTCLRKNYGCIIVKNDEIIATRIYRCTKRT
jgi:deoxycytidylate deaminase